MHKAAIQKFAMQARADLLQQVAQRAYQYGITAEGFADPNGKAFSPEEQTQRRQLVQEMQKKGYDQVIEDVAYTWFSRFITLRFLEVNGYLPSGVRVFSDNTGAFQPEILQNVTHLALPGLDMDRVTALEEKNQTEELYRYLFLLQCGALNEVLPRMFDKLGDFAELLLPNNLLTQDSVPEKMVNGIPEADWIGQVQIIGWLYQHYHSQRKDETFALLKKNVKITKERLPFATQLFTPDWIVRYMVENSLGRLWIEGHPNGDLKSNWKYYLEEAPQEPGVQKQLEAIRAEYRQLRPQDIKVIDPCMGSGHILVYCFDVLMQIYKSRGYSQQEAARNILLHNLYGLDIDDRAAQLAYFAVMMKARQYDRQIFSMGLEPHVYATRESNGINRDAIDYLAKGDPKLEQALHTLADQLYDAREYGSLVHVSPVDFGALKACINEALADDSPYNSSILHQIQPLVLSAEVMARKYDVVVTNPPYMGASGMSSKLSAYVKKHYPDSKADLFAVFMERCGQMTGKNRYQAMITQHAWMFLSSYERLRAKLLHADTVNMAHLGPRAFEEIGGEVVQTTSFVLRRGEIAGYQGTYCRLLEPTSQQGKEELFLSGNCRYIAQKSSFSQIPGAPIAYWVSDKFIETFNNHLLGDVATPKQGVATANNNYYLRQWFECEYDDINFTCKSHADAETSPAKWYPYNKGGEFRKWYGNNDYVVNWQHDGFALRHDKKAVIRNPDYFFKRCISWSLISSQATAFRFKPEGFIFDVAGMSCFAADNLYYLCGFCNTKVAYNYLKILAPTINFQVGDIAKLPVIIDKRHKARVEALVKNNIALSKKDWDSFEISWEFERHPLIRSGHLGEAYDAWCQECSDRFNRLKANEEAINEIFIRIYGLEDEMTSDVPDQEVTVRKADLGRDIRGLLSYAVGCLFGRYSLDVPGLAYAGGEWDDNKYSTFIPDKDNCIPITDEAYFEDDIVGQFVGWMKKAFGEENLETNLDFIANALGNKGATSREVIRNYFLNDFMKDHIKMYQKRPIYWLFDSGKQDGFKVLVYMHRWNADTVGNLRVEYLHKMQHTYEREIVRMQETIDNSRDSREVSKATKRKDKLQKQLRETKDYDAKLAHIALSRIEIDLDDGVKVNYEKVQTGKDGKKMQILTKI